MTPYLIDANICLGFLNESDSLHTQSKNLVEHLRMRGNSFVLLDHVIQEILTVLLYQKQYFSIDSFIQTFLIDQSVLPVDSPISWLEDATHLAKQRDYHPKMSLTDWLLLSRSMETGTPILTLDRQLLNASKMLS